MNMSHHPKIIQATNWKGPHPSPPQHQSNHSYSADLHCPRCPPCPSKRDSKTALSAYNSCFCRTLAIPQVTALVCNRKSKSLRTWAPGPQNTSSACNHQSKCQDWQRCRLVFHSEGQLFSQHNSMYHRYRRLAEGNHSSLFWSSLPGL